MTGRAQQADASAGHPRSTATPPGRRAALAKIHVAKKQLALEDESYRALLRRAAGRDSAGDCTDAELTRVLAEFKRLGFQAPKRASGKPHVRKVYALWGALKPYLTDASAAALRAFVRRQTGVADPEWLDPRQANLVTEGLKAWLKRVQARDDQPGASDRG